MAVAFRSAVFRKDFQRLTGLRIAEARTLLRGRHFDGVYYLGGLAAECALKACIARATQRYEFPDRDLASRVYTHSLVALLREAQLDKQLAQATARVQENWATVKDWRVEIRYTTGKSEAEGRAFLAAVADREGVVPWLRRFW